MLLASRIRLRLGNAIGHLACVCVCALNANGLLTCRVGARFMCSTIASQVQAYKYAAGSERTKTLVTDSIIACQ